VVSALDFRSEGRWFDGRLEGGVVSLDNILRPSLSLSTQVYGYRRHTAVGKPCNGLASRPGGSSKYSQLLHATETWISSGRVGLLGPSAILSIVCGCDRLLCLKTDRCQSISLVDFLRSQYNPKMQELLSLCNKVRGGGGLYGFPSNFLQTTHLNNSYLVKYRPGTIQKFDLSSVSVSLTPLCVTLL